MEMSAKKETSLESADKGSDAVDEHDVFGDEHGHDIQYKTLSWQVVSSDYSQYIPRRAHVFVLS